MSSFDRRRFLTLALVGVVAACGFRPVYRKGSQGIELKGDIQLPEARNPITFTYRERLRRRFGDAGESATFLLESETEISESELAITQASDVTRYRLTGTTTWRLIKIEDGSVVLSDQVSAFTGYDATSSAYSVRSARKAADERLATELAELTITGLSAYSSETGA